MSSSETLATKYRPTSFKDVAGQQSAVTRLKGILKTGKTPSAILFVGGSGAGKTTLARMFANYLNCETNKLCGKCPSCQQSSSHPDVQELNAADARGIDDVRSLIQQARFKPSLAKFRIIILNEAQQLTAQAQQAILQPIEDSPRSTIWIFTSMEPEKLHAAVLNRCSIISLTSPDRDEIAARIEQIAKLEQADYVDDKIAKQIAESSGGSVRNAVSILESVIQYVDGSPKSSDIKQVIESAIQSSSSASIEQVATKLLVALYKGSLASVHSTLLDCEDYAALLNKLTQLNMYVIDQFIQPSHKAVWHTATNKKLIELCNKHVDNFGKKLLPALLQVQHEINQLKLEMGTFLANDRALFSARLGLLALKQKG